MKQEATQEHFRRQGPHSFVIPIRTRDRVRLRNQLEALLEEAHIKLCSLVSDLLGASARRMLKALADGETDPAALAALADQRLRATPAQLRDALRACPGL